MQGESLEDRLARFDSPAHMLRSAAATKYVFPMAPEYSNWRDEQEAWKNAAVLFDQSFHMADYYFKGPDVKRLFTAIGVNSMTTFGKNKAKQLVMCNYDGYVIQDAILFGLDDDEYALVGSTVAVHWAAFQAETGGYDVAVVRDEPSGDASARLTFRFQLNGPNAQQIVEAAHGGPIERIKFFNMGETTIEGCTVRILNHTMAGVPGRDMTGLELMGSVEHRGPVLAKLLEVGAEFGLRQGGSRSYLSALMESGWIPSPTPAIYTGEKMRSYREWLSAYTFEGFGSIGGSFASGDIEDYYHTPWDIGLGHTIKFDHDFIGREALEKLADQPHRRKVWLRWNEDDFMQVLRDGLFAPEGERPKLLDLPTASWIHYEHDKVMIDDRMVGLSMYAGYTTNVGAVASLAIIDEADSVDGAEVVVVWGDGNASKPYVEPHKLTEIRATISAGPLV
jgi:glycine cleavage system aminomethyltransferase T